LNLCGKQLSCFLGGRGSFARSHQPCTDGQTYAEAATHGQEVIELLLEYFENKGMPIPEPKVYPAHLFQAA
jgi:hypothetical protein